MSLKYEPSSEQEDLRADGEAPQEEEKHIPPRSGESSPQESGTGVPRP